MRYEVSVEMRLVYNFAVEAESPTDAHTAASEQVAERAPDELFMRTHVQKGVDGR